MHTRVLALTYVKMAFKRAPAPSLGEFCCPAQSPSRIPAACECQSGVRPWRSQEDQRRAQPMGKLTCRSLSEGSPPASRPLAISSDSSNSEPQDPASTLPDDVRSAQRH